MIKITVVYMLFIICLESYRCYIIVIIIKLVFYSRSVYGDHGLYICQHIDFWDPSSFEEFESHTSIHFLLDLSFHYLNVKRNFYFYFVYLKPVNGT